MKIAVTGANGFVGRATLAALASAGLEAVPLVRQASGLANERLAPSLGTEVDWTTALTGCGALVHLAARVHMMKERDTDPLAIYRQVNTAGTLHLAREAVRAGVRRFVFVSTAKVLGEATLPGQSFSTDAPLAPDDPYAISKAEAETGLAAIARASGLECTIVRPPLVYGPGVGANFRKMIEWVARGVPLPLGAVDNRRSLIGVDNLAALLAHCAVHPAASDGVFHATDNQDVSTSDLLRKIANFLGRAPRLIPVPPALLGLVLRMAGGGALEQRLCGSLCLDSASTRMRLHWQPPHSLDQQLQKTVMHFLQARL